MFRAQQNAFDDAVGESCGVLAVSGYFAAGRKSDLTPELRRRALWTLEFLDQC